ncbi:MAG: hypothetical protein SAMD01599839_05820 [Rectinema sp.]
MRRFSLYQRQKIYYAQFFNPETKKYLPGKSTGKTVRDEALLVVNDWLQNGIPNASGKKARPVADALTLETVLDGIRHIDLTTNDAARIVAALKDKGLIETAIVKAGQGSVLVGDYLKAFWDYDKSPYIHEKHAHGQRIGKRHCYDMELQVKNHWKPYFKSRRLDEIRKSDLRDFGVFLADKGLSYKSINNIFDAGSVAFHYAFGNEVIASDPSAGLLKFSGTPRKRGILTDKEVSALFAVQWKDERSRVGNLLAMTTGLRAGEVQGLRVCDIGDDRLFIRHSWSGDDRLKSTKTNRERQVPLIPVVREGLLRLVEMNPYGGKNAFIFFSVRSSDCPMDAHFLLDGLDDALEKIGISKEQRMARNVCFHSWRHAFAAKMADRIGERAMILTGHTSSEVFEHYADHATEKDFLEVSGATREAFSETVRLIKTA